MIDVTRSLTLPGYINKNYVLALCHDNIVITNSIRFITYYVCTHVKSAAPLLCTNQFYLNMISNTFVYSR